MRKWNRCRRNTRQLWPIDVDMAVAANEIHRSFKDYMPCESSSNTNKSSKWRTKTLNEIKRMAREKEKQHELNGLAQRAYCTFIGKWNTNIPHECQSWQILSKSFPAHSLFKFKSNIIPCIMRVRFEILWNAHILSHSVHWLFFFFILNRNVEYFAIFFIACIASP